MNARLLIPAALIVLYPHFASASSECASAFETPGSASVQVRVLSIDPLPNSRLGRAWFRLRQTLHRTGLWYHPEPWLNEKAAQDFTTQIEDALIRLSKEDPQLKSVHLELKFFNNYLRRGQLSGKINAVEHQLIFGEPLDFSSPHDPIQIQDELLDGVVAAVANRSLLQSPHDIWAECRKLDFQIRRLRKTIAHSTDTAGIVSKLEHASRLLQRARQSSSLGMLIRMTRAKKLLVTMVDQVPNAFYPKTQIPVLRSRAYRSWFQDIHDESPVAPWLIFAYLSDIFSHPSERWVMESPSAFRDSAGVEAEPSVTAEASDEGSRSVSQDGQKASSFDNDSSGGGWSSGGSGADSGWSGGSSSDSGGGSSSSFGGGSDSGGGWSSSDSGGGSSGGDF